ncbi:MAG: hypothetical protein COB66_07360, partial [Coxiella sp. (in: Bacteria)]
TALQTVSKPAVQPAVTPTAPVATAANTAMNTMSQGQHAYVTMLNQYEVVKMRHQLLDEEAAVANAQHQIAVVTSKTSKLTGAEGLPMSTGLGNNGLDDNIVLSYIDQQGGQWSATLHSGGRYQSVHIGSRLQNDYQVIGIDHQGVTLEKGKVEELVTFNGITTLPNLAGPVTTQQIADVAKAMTQTQGVQGEQAHLLAMQLVHDGKTAPAVARNGLQVAPSQLALKEQAPAAVVLSRPAPKLPAYQISIDDNYAHEDEDDMQNQQLSADLHLRSVVLAPVINQAYNVSSYLPQQVSVPQAYSLDQENSVSTDEQQYAREGLDTEMPAPRKLNFSEKKLLRLPKNYYTIQLIGSYHSDVVNQFVVDNELKNVAVQLRVGNQSHPWAIALYGVFPNFEKAEERLVHLPARMRLDGAWVRKVGDVQRVLRHHL